MSGLDGMDVLVVMPVKVLMTQQFTRDGSRVMMILIRIVLNQ